MKTLFAGGRKTSITASAFNVVNYYPISGIIVPVSTEANVRTVIRVDATISNLSINVSANTVNGARTFRSRVSGANGNLSVSISASTTGFFRDTSNSDSVVAGDTFAYQMGTGGTSGNTSVSAITTVVDSSGSGSYLLQGGTVSVTGSGTTYMWPPAIGGNATEANIRYKFNAATVARNLRVYASTNTYNAAVTCTVRKNAADGSVTLSIPASTSGAFEDTSNTDSFSAGDFISLSRVAAAGAGTLSIQSVVIELRSNSGLSFLPSVSSAGLTFSTTTSRYFQLGSAAEDQTGEPIEEFYFDGTLSHLQCYVSANSTTSASTMAFRINAADSSAVLSVASGTTGHFENTTDTASVTAGDDVGLKWANGSAHSLTLQYCGALFAEPAAATSARVFAWVCG